MLEAIGILPIAAVLGAARGLHIGCLPWLRTERTQRGRRMKGACADLHVVGLEDDAAAPRPKGLQGQDQPLKGSGGVERGVGKRHRTLSRAWDRRRTLEKRPCRVNETLFGLPCRGSVAKAEEKHRERQTVCARPNAPTTKCARSCSSVGWLAMRRAPVLSGSATRTCSAQLRSRTSRRRGYAGRDGVGSPRNTQCCRGRH